MDPALQQLMDLLTTHDQGGLSAGEVRDRAKLLQQAPSNQPLVAHLLSLLHEKANPTTPAAPAPAVGHASAPVGGPARASGSASAAVGAPPPPPGPAVERHVGGVQMQRLPDGSVVAVMPPGTHSQDLQPGAAPQGSTRVFGQQPGTGFDVVPNHQPTLLDRLLSVVR